MHEWSLAATLRIPLNFLRKLFILTDSERFERKLESMKYDGVFFWRVISKKKKKVEGPYCPKCIGEKKIFQRMSSLRSNYQCDVCLLYSGLVEVFSDGKKINWDL